MLFLAMEFEMPDHTTGMQYLKLCMFETYQVFKIITNIPTKHDNERLCQVNSYLLEVKAPTLIIQKWF